MIDRFNFYDIYGYLLPGLVLSALLGLPLALIAGKLPPAELGSALAAAVLGYVVGQIGHAFARRVFSEERPFAAQVARLPDGRQKRLREKFVTLVGWHITIDDPSVFVICRRALQDLKRGQLADQFQGMYALTRGLALAFYAAAAYYAGVCVGGFTRQPSLTWSFVVPLGAAFLWLYVALKNSAAARPKSLTTQAPNQINDEELPQNPWPLVERVVAAIVLVVFGVIAGLFVPLHPHRFMAFGVAVPFCLLFAMRLHRVSSEHDIAVAKTVLNDFLVEPPAKTPGEDKAK